ncbi:MAG: hypothetical protein JSV65_12620 [Armatimonadota bacterium]|nr:MAG: hypothetical protein JSV65_12620 [Armatimonadota bacterium]
MRYVNCRPWLIVAAAMLLPRAGASAPAAPSPNACPAVKLIRHGPVWTLSNGIVEVAFDTERVGVREFRFTGAANVLAEDGMYLDCNVPEGYYGFTKHGNPTMESARVCARTRQYVDVAVRGRFYDPGAAWASPLIVDWHVVLQRGDPGFYSYITAAHQPGAGEMELGQLRAVLRCAERFADYALTPQRTGRWADHDWKYTLSRRWEPWSAHGLVDPMTRESVWAVYGLKHWCRGPDQRDLTLHDGIILTMFEAGHYGVFPTSRPSSARVRRGWRKLYGPVFYMLTRGGSIRQMYAAASARGDEDRRHWPPPWLAEEVGQPATVRGEVAPSSLQEPVRVVLRNDRYIFWTTCSPGQAFRISGVFPGEYDLIARQGPHASAKARTVSVTEEGLNVAQVRLAPSIPRGKLLWEIGTLDDSCEEFAGGPHCWDFEGFKLYAEEFQETHAYTVGESRPDRDWYWIHPGPLDDFAGSKVHPWTIRFDLQAVPQRSLLLHIVFADTMSAAHISPPVYRVELNGRKLASLQLADGGQAGTYCVADVGVPQHYRIRVPRQALVAGSNVLVVYPEKNSYVMYDYIALREPGR